MLSHVITNTVATGVKELLYKACTAYGAVNLLGAGAGTGAMTGAGAGTGTLI